jgi:hypothetical protein
MSGGTAQSAQLTAITIAPHRTLTLDVPAIIAATGLKNFNGSVNLELDTRAQPGALALASGSVDQTHTYVFEVIPRGADESASQALCYWSTGNGDDTMITLWNAADEQQDLIFTLFFSGGHYAYPIQLQPRATRTFNISEILHSSNPDAEGNIVPAAVFEGSAEIAGSQGEHQHISVSMDAGVYNVRKAICGNPCVTCNGLVNSFVVTSPFAVAVGASRQQTFYMQYNTGSQFNLNGHSSWSSNATSVATVSAGLVSGIGPGSPTIFAQDNFFEPDFIACATSLRDCSLKTNASRPGGSAPGNVFNGVLTPQDNFSGRSTSRFGIAEVINLSFNAQTTAAALGGLQWTIVSGGGTLTNAGTAGTATYTAPAMAATVVLRIAVASGSSQGQHRDYSIAIITPSGGLESKFSNVRHKQGDVSVGFLAHIFLEPTDVSFANLQFAEGSAPAVASGYFGPLNGHLHPPTSSPVPIGSCDSVIGCEVAATGGDQIDTGDDPPPFSNGDFLWSIPWQYQAPGGALTTFTTVNHHSTAVATSSTAATATIEKGGAGPFSKNSSDPTTTY